MDPHLLPVPFAISDKSGHPLVILSSKTQLEAWNRGEYTLIPAPGIAVHPASIRVNDSIGFVPTGTDRMRVTEIAFKNEGTPWHWRGVFSFVGSLGTMSVQIDGNRILAPTLYQFPSST
jgi:hypothetical protein